MVKSDLLAGFNQQVITPPSGVSMGGYSSREGVSRGTHDELFARALVLSDGTIKVAVLVVDLLLVPGKLTKVVRERIARGTDIDRNNILICATHTHSGPVVWLPNHDREFLFSTGNPINKKWQQLLPETLSNAVQSANESLKPVTRIAVGSAAVDLCGIRRLIDPLGDVRLLPDPGRSMDSQVGFIKIDREEDSILVINYACHPVVLCEDNLLYTGDYPAFTISYIEQKSREKLKVIFTNGACGNVDPLVRGDFNKAAEMGRALAETILEALPQLKTLNHPELAVRTFVASLPIKQLPTLVEMRQYIGKIRSILDRHGPHQDYHFQRLKHEYALALRKRYLLEWLYEYFPLNRERGVVEAEIQFLTLNKQVALLSIPGELFFEIGERIKESIAMPYVYIIGYCNDYIGYIPTGQAYKEGGYEVQGALLAPGSGEKLSDIIKNELMVT